MAIASALLKQADFSSKRISTLTLLRVLRSMLRERAERAPYSDQFTIEVRDLEAFGYFSHRTKTAFGRLLNTLARKGFLYVAKKTRPRHYVAKKWLIMWALICTYPDCKDTCGLHGACPYHVLGYRGVISGD